jgi:hypothetical protein
MFCPNCGYQASDDAKFCGKCGNRISEAEQQPNRPVYQESGRGTMIFVFGLLGLVMFGPFLGLPAWIMGHRDLRKIREGIIPPGEESLTKAGYILGIIATALWGIIILAVFFSILVGIALFREALRSGYHDVLYSTAYNLKYFFLA